METWPSKFVILRDNFTIEPVTRIIRSSMDMGPAKVRRRSVLTMRNIKFTMLLTPDERTEFEEFYLNNDAFVFNFTRPDTNEEVKARFTAPPTFSFNQTRWNVGASLEVLP